MPWGLRGVPGGHVHHLPYLNWISQKKFSLEIACTFKGTITPLAGDGWVTQKARLRYDKHVFSMSFLHSCPCVMSLTVTLNPTSCKKPTLSQKPRTSAHVCLEGGAQTRAWASCCLSLWLPHTPPLIPPLQTQRQTSCVSLALSDWQPKQSVSWRKPSFGLTSILSHETLLSGFSHHKVTEIKS